MRLLAAETLVWPLKVRGALPVRGKHQGAKSRHGGAGSSWRDGTLVPHPASAMLPGPATGAPGLFQSHLSPIVSLPVLLEPRGRAPQAATLCRRHKRRGTRPPAALEQREERGSCPTLQRRAVGFCGKSADQNARGLWQCSEWQLTCYHAKAVVGMQTRSRSPGCIPATMCCTSAAYVAFHTAIFNVWPFLLSSNSNQVPCSAPLLISSTLLIPRTRRWSTAESKVLDALPLHFSLATSRWSRG